MGDPSNRTNKLTVAASLEHTWEAVARLRVDDVKHMVERVDVVLALLNVADEAERVAESYPQLAPLRQALDRLRAEGAASQTAR